jgi:hypothetical protein
VEPPAPLVDPAAPTPPAADPAPATPPAEGPPPALPPEAAPPPLPPPAPAPKRRVRGGHQREEREEPWGECFKMAPVHPEGGPLTAFSATCLIHTADNSRCNKSLNLGARFGLDEAQRRIKKWCLDGVAIANEAGSKALHMQDNPRSYSEGDVPLEHDEMDTRALDLRLIDFPILR